MKDNSLILKAGIFILFLIAFLERTVFDLGPNYELLTSALVLSSLFTDKKITFLLTLIVLAFSDRIIGNSKIFLFTWTGFLIPSYFLPTLINRLKIKNQKVFIKMLCLGGTGLITNLFFYLHTNFGVWILDSWGMYSKDFPGLVRCYINGLPFLKNQITSTLIFIPLGLVLIERLIIFYKNTVFIKNPGNIPHLKTEEK